MPNSRRRKFSVRDGIASREPPKIQNGIQTSVPDREPDITTVVNNFVSTKKSKTKNKINTNSSKIFNTEITGRECSSSMVTVKKCSHTAVDKQVLASSSNIDLFHKLFFTEESAGQWKESGETVNKTVRNDTPTKKFTRPKSHDRIQLKRAKHPRQHRIKVRSHSHRMEIGTVDTHKSNEINKPTMSAGTEVIDWDREVETCSDNPQNVTESMEEEERHSDNSSDDMCRICHGGECLSLELGQLISACSCRGTVGRVHVKCLERWLTESGKSRCELCGTRYATRRVHRYGVPRALLMWILSQNAKQLMVDSLGIMLMSPLAVLAAWLSGRTLAGLMTQEAHSTPWPLASTFVLACMTLVCYYCWIVSAATRHALGWWIWYRSQYEVRLELMDVDD